MCLSLSLYRALKCLGWPLYSGYRMGHKLFKTCLRRPPQPVEGRSNWIKNEKSAVVVIYCRVRGDIDSHATLKMLEEEDTAPDPGIRSNE